MLMPPMPHRIKGSRQISSKPRATASPEEQKKVKHQLAAEAAQIGVSGKPVFGLLGRGILP
jgi:hypothetical protein